VDYAVAVALEVVAIGMPRLRITPSAAVRGAKSVRGKHGDSVTERAAVGEIG
jgi:hypothetical protein